MSRDELNCRILLVIMTTWLTTNQQKTVSEILHSIASLLAGLSVLVIVDRPAGKFTLVALRSHRKYMFQQGSHAAKTFSP